MAKLVVEGRATTINPNLRLVNYAHAHNDDDDKSWSCDEPAACRQYGVKKRLQSPDSGVESPSNCQGNKITTSGPYA